MTWNGILFSDGGKGKERRLYYCVITFVRIQLVGDGMGLCGRCESVGTLKSMYCGKESLVAFLEKASL